MESEADRLAMLKSLGGGACVHASGQLTPAIFDDAYVPASISGEMQLADSSPAITVTTREASRLKLKQGARIEVIAQGATTPYAVRFPQPDGQGMSVLLLDAVA